MISIWPTVWRAAGIIGVEPWGFSYFELATMLKEQLTAHWDHTAAITCMIANANRGKGKPPVKPDQLNPMRQGSGRTQLNRDNISILTGLAGKVE